MIEKSWKRGEGGGKRVQERRYGVILIAKLCEQTGRDKG